MKTLFDEKVVVEFDKRELYILKQIVKFVISTESKQVFGDSLGLHIYNKWLGKHEYSHDVTMSWYADLDTECRQKLVDRANEIYGE